MGSLRSVSPSAGADHPSAHAEWLNSAGHSHVRDIEQDTSFENDVTARVEILAL
jgi:hypothetical protein